MYSETNLTLGAPNTALVQSIIRIMKMLKCFMVLSSVIDDIVEFFLFKFVYFMNQFSHFKYPPFNHKTLYKRTNNMPNRRAFISQI